jgi:hypothetical protein
LTAENEDRLLYEPDYAIWCEDDDGPYEEGEFELGPGRIVHWLTRQPNQGLRYSLKYAAFLEWIAFVPPQERRDGDQDLGSLFYLRRRHVALPNENPFVVPPDRISLKEHLG